MACNNETKFGTDRLPSRFMVPTTVALVALMLAAAPVTLGTSGFTFLSAKASTVLDLSSPDQTSVDPTSVDKSGQSTNDAAGQSADNSGSGTSANDGSNGASSNGSSHDGGKSGGEGGDR